MCGPDNSENTGHSSLSSDLLRALALLEVGRHEDAEQFAGRVLASDPANEQALLIVGRCRIAAGDPKTAVRISKENLGRHPGSLAGHRFRVEALASAGHHRTSLSAAEDGLAEFPDDPGLLASASFAAQRVHLLRRANEYARRLAAVEPGSVATFNSLGLVALRERDYAAAARNFRDGLAIDPENITLQNNLAICLAETGAPDQAIELLGRSLRADPTRAATKQNMAFAVRRYGFSAWSAAAFLVGAGFAFTARLTERVSLLWFALAFFVVGTAAEGIRRRRLGDGPRRLAREQRRAKPVRSRLRNPLVVGAVLLGGYALVMVLAR